MKKLITAGAAMAMVLSMASMGAMAEGEAVDVSVNTYSKEIFGDSDAAQEPQRRILFISNGSTDPFSFFTLISIILFSFFVLSIRVSSILSFFI